LSIMLMVAFSLSAVVFNRMQNEPRQCCVILTTIAEQPIRCAPEDFDSQAIQLG